MTADRVGDVAEEYTCFVRRQTGPPQLGYIRINVDKCAATVFSATGLLLYQLAASDVACVVDDPTVPSGVQVRLASEEPLVLSHLLRKPHLAEMFKAIGKWSGQERPPLTEAPQVRAAVDTRQVPQGDTPPEDPLPQHICSSLGGATALGSGTHTDTQHTVTAEKVLDQFRDQFIKEMEAKKVTEELLHKDIISRGDQQTITREVDPTLQNQILHRCLKEKCTLDALRSVCATIKAVKGNPKMVALGGLMMRRLEMETGATALGSGTHTDTQHTVTEDHREGPHNLEQQRGHAVTQAPPGPFDKLRGYYTSSPVVQNSFPLRSEEAAMGYVEPHLIKHHKRVPRAKPDEERSSVNLWKDGVEEFPHQTVPLKYEDIFNFPPDGDGSRRGVLVEGVPGSGKTTLVKRMCRDWANGSFAQDSKAVIQVVLRSLPKRDELTIEDMVLTSVGDKKEAAEIAQYIRDCQGDGVVFILDGYDELPEEMRQSSIVRDILKGHLAPKASFLITSRPISAQSLYPLVDRRIEVTGFGEEEVEKYVTDYFATSDAAVGEELISTLHSRPTIRNLCFVPLLLRMVCFMASFGKALPRTMHELFEGLVILTVNCNLEKANRKERANSLEDVKQLCPSFMKLAQLALEGLKHDTLVFSDVPFEVDEALSGLMNCIEAQNRFGGTTRTWHFLYLPLQEYFAAYALSVAPEAEQICFWSERLLFKYVESMSSACSPEYILCVDRFQTMFLLYCGITGLGSKTGVQAMLVKAADGMFEPAIRRESALSALCQAVGESGNRELARRIMSTCGSSIQLRLLGILPVGIPWCIEVYGQHTEELHLSIHCSFTSGAADFFSQMKDLVTLTGLELELNILYGQDDLPHLKAIAQFLIRQRALKHLKLDLGRTYTEDEVSCFWSVLEHHNGSLESLGLSRCEVTQSCVITILNKLPNLTALNFGSIALPANEREDQLVTGAISSAVYNHPSLKELTTIYGCSPSLVNGAVGGIVRKAGVKKLVVDGDFPDHLLPQAIHSLKNQSLEVLRLRLSLKSPNTVELFRALPQSRLKEFQFNSFGSQADDPPAALCQEMEKGISGCSTLTKLSLHRLPPQCASASMQAAMALQASLGEVKWSLCSFRSPLLKKFAVHLKHSRLQKVTFILCTLTSADVATLLAEGLTENRTLEQLLIASLSTPEEVVDATLLEKVETSIESNKSLQMLYSDIKHSRVEEAVLKGARGNTSLKKLTIRTQSYDQLHLNAAAAELQQVRPELELRLFHF